MKETEWTTPTKGFRWLGEQVGRYGLLFLVITIFYRQDVPHAWSFLLLILLIIGIALRGTGRENWNLNTLWGFCLIALPVGLLISTQIMAPEYRMDWLRQFMLPMLIAPLIASTFTSPRYMEQLSHAFAWSGAVLAAVNLHQYYQEYQAVGHFNSEIALHRFYGDGLIVVLPFALMQAINSQHLAPRIGWISLVSMEAMMLLLTGMRGAWLAAAASIVLIVLFIRSPRVWGVLAAITALGCLTIVLAPPELVMTRMLNLFNMSSRTETVWQGGVAIKLAMQHPFTGHGFSNALYLKEFALLQPDRLSHNLGPHNTYISMLFFGGFIALGLYLLLLFGLIATILKRIGGGMMQQNHPYFRHATNGLAIAAALLAAYAVHGVTESKSWLPFGALVGAAMAWLSSKERIT